MSVTTLRCGPGKSSLPPAVDTLHQQATLRPLTCVPTRAHLALWWYQGARRSPANCDTEFSVFQDITSHTPSYVVAMRSLCERIA